jgi:hypothetical protein
MGIFFKATVAPDGMTGRGNAALVMFKEGLIV